VHFVGTDERSARAARGPQFQTCAAHPYQSPF
jgi:hypothetical protein